VTWCSDMTWCSSSGYYVCVYCVCVYCALHDLSLTRVCNMTWLDHTCDMTQSCVTQCSHKTWWSGSGYWVCVCIVCVCIVCVCIVCVCIVCVCIVCVCIVCVCIVFVCIVLFMIRASQPMDESRHTYEWVIWMSHVTHMNESCQTWISHVTQWKRKLYALQDMDESCRTYERVLSHSGSANVVLFIALASQNMDESRRAYECVMSRSGSESCARCKIWMSHVMCDVVR